MPDIKAQHSVDVVSKGVPPHQSSGFLFNSVCQSKTFILTSKHSICPNRFNCPNRNGEDLDCRSCKPICSLDNIEILHQGNKLELLNLVVSDCRDISLVESSFTDGIPTIVKTNAMLDEYRVWVGQGKTRHCLDKPENLGDGRIRFNISSNSTANLRPKDDVFKGTSGGLVFMKHQAAFYASAVITGDGNSNDVIGELLDPDLIEELNRLSGVKVVESQNLALIPSPTIKAIPVQSYSGPNTLQNLIRKSEALSREDPDYEFMLQELSTFLSNRPGREIIGLQGKLSEGNRLDLLEDAEHLENRFSRRISGNQFSKTDEVISCHCLSMINSIFQQTISPAIKRGASDEEVNSLILSEIVQPLYGEVSRVAVSYNADTIRGMVYFLTGKCHIRWNK